MTYRYKARRAGPVSAGGLGNSSSKLKRRRSHSRNPIKRGRGTNRGKPRRLSGAATNRKRASTSSVNQLEFTNLKSDDLAILSVYIEIISSIVGLWSLYLARQEDEEEDEKNAAAAEEPPIPFGAVRNQLRRRKKPKRKH